MFLIIQNSPSFAHVISRYSVLSSKFSAFYLTDRIRLISLPMRQQDFFCFIYGSATFYVS